MEVATATTAIDAAVQRGRDAATSDRYEPVTVDHNGRLTARIKDTRSGEVEGIYIQGSQLIFTQLGRSLDGTVKCHTVRTRELKKIVRAMIGRPPNELFTEAFAERRRTMAENSGNGRRLRRGRVS